MAHSIDDASRGHLGRTHDNLPDVGTTRRDPVSRLPAFQSGKAANNLVTIVERVTVGFLIDSGPKLEVPPGVIVVFTGVLR